jgi:hypothetical protein
MLYIETASEDMETDNLFSFLEDALNRIKTNQEANEYVQYQLAIVESMLSEIKERV